MCSKAVYEGYASADVERYGFLWLELGYIAFPSSSGQYRSSPPLNSPNARIHDGPPFRESRCLLAAYPLFMHIDVSGGSFGIPSSSGGSCAPGTCAEYHRARIATTLWYFVHSTLAASLPVR